VERKAMKTDVFETHEMRKGTTDFVRRGTTDLVTRDQLFDRINDYLNDEPLKIGDGDYYYTRIVGNHLEIGRAKIHLEE
jgi:hypothetical protein